MSNKRFTLNPDVGYDSDYGLRGGPPTVVQKCGCGEVIRVCQFGADWIRSVKECPQCHGEVICGSVTMLDRFGGLGVLDKDGQNIGIPWNFESQFYDDLATGPDPDEQGMSGCW